MSAGWMQSPLKHWVQINPEVLPEDHDPAAEIEYVDISNVNQIQGILSTERMYFGDAPSRARRVVRGGDTIVSTVRTYLKAVAPVRDPPDNMIVSTGFAVLRPRSQANAGFVGWLAQSEGFIQAVVARSVGVSYPAINPSVLGGLPVRFPSMENQNGIAEFLDRETVRIDALIAKKERLIELLEQERLTATDLLITREDGPPKRLKFCILSIEQGWSPQCENREADPGEWGVLKVSAVNYGRFRPEENKALPATELPLLEYEVHEGDVLMSRANTRTLLGAAVCVPPFLGRLLLCDKLYRIIPREDQLIPQYIPLALQTRYSRFQIEREATGASASMQNIGQDTVRNVVINTPTIYRQRVLITAVAEVEARIHSVASRVVKAIDTLREYRTALISAAVTGQIDVRTYRKEPEAVLETA